MEFVIVAIFFSGLVLGFIIASFFLKNKFSGSSLNQEQFESLKNENLSLTKDLEHLNIRLNGSFDELKKQKEREIVLQGENTALNSSLAASRTNLKNALENLESQKSELAGLQERFTKEFKLVANAILKENSNDFSQAHQKELKLILNPLQEKIKAFESKVEERFGKSRDEQLSLKHEIKTLTELNNVLNQQAQNLTEALRGENKTQGNWGELVLERILESSGLIKGQEYETQFSDTNSEDKRIQPDVVIKLPEEKHIVIDSKVSLVSYERFVNSDDPDFKAEQLKLHIASVKSHVKLLSDKNYQTGFGLNTPDFVLLFMPIESSFSLAAQQDDSLFSFAWEKKVVIVSPTTLLATLRTIASVWKHERQSKNAIDIADRAGRLYDKFKSFVDDMQKIERGLISAQTSYNDALNKLSRGKGNLIGRAENIKALGAKANKSLPKELIENFEDND